MERGGRGMRILHVFFDPPDETDRELAAMASEGAECGEFVLTDEPPDYARLLERIAAADRVISWF